MGLLHNFLNLTLGLLALVGGIALVVVSLVPGLWAQALAALTPAAVGVWALVVALAGLAQLMTGLALRPRPLVAYDNEGGAVSVSAQSIRDVILRLAPEFPGLVRMDPVIGVRRGVLCVNIKVTMREGPAVQETCELLQHRVRERLCVGLGLAQVGRVEVSVRDVIPGGQ